MGRPSCYDHIPLETGRNEEISKSNLPSQIIMDIHILVEKFCNYLTSMKGYSSDTIRRYKGVVSHYCKMMNINEIDKVNDDNVREMFYVGRTQRKWSSNTFIVYHKTLRVFFRWCVKQGYLEKNPVDDIEKPRIEKKLPYKLTKQMALNLLELVDNYPYGSNFLRYRNHAIFATFIFCGLRKQELLNLKYTDVDIENLTIFVRQGKGNKDRVVPMSYTLAQTLKKYRNERKRLNKTCPEFFASSRENMGFTVNGLKKLIDQVRIASGMKFSAHKLRHTFATLMLEGGCDIYSLSKMMGHSDIKTTTIYLSASADLLRSQMIKHPLNDLV